jgi:hypothetical protein
MLQLHTGRNITQDTNKLLHQEEWQFKQSPALSLPVYRRFYGNETQTTANFILICHLSINVGVGHI